VVNSNLNQGDQDLPALASNANHLVLSVGKNMSANYALEGVYASGMSDSSTTSLGTAITSN
jgi:hypothetical protein